MKILQVNKFYYNRRGAEKYMLALNEGLTKAGHQVAVFSMQHPKNLPSIWSKYFISRISFNEGGFLDKLKMPGRLFYSFEAKRKFRALIKDFQPDLIHIHNIYHHISPSILDVARKYKIPVIMHLHDYKLICPNYKLFIKGKPCERCKKNLYYNCLLNRCVNGSWSRSVGAVLEMYLHNVILKIYRKSLTRLIAPSKFIKDRFVAFGWPAEMIDVIYNSFDQNLLGETLPEEDYILYFGGLSEEKGVETLIKAAAKTGLKTKIAGDGRQGQILKSLSDKLKAPIEFCGFKSGNDLRNLILRAKAVIIPSIWPENMPLSLLESLSLGKIVIASNIGGIPEIIQDGFNGFLFEAGNCDDLIKKIKHLEELDISEKEKIKQAAKLSIKELNSQNNLNSVLKVYTDILN